MMIFMGFNLKNNWCQSTWICFVGKHPAHLWDVSTSQGFPMYNASTQIRPFFFFSLPDKIPLVVLGALTFLQQSPQFSDSTEISFNIRCSLRTRIRSLKSSNSFLWKKIKQGHYYPHICIIQLYFQKDFI